jgi:hypothetical protein
MKLSALVVIVLSNTPWGHIWQVLEGSQPAETVVFHAQPKPVTTTNKTNTHSNPICQIILPIQEYSC